MTNHYTPPIDQTSRVFFYLCTIFCVSFGVWAAIAPLDIVSDAVGEVVPSSRVKRIQHLEGGIVSAIKVREGDIVAVEQPLIELETTASDSGVEELNVRIASLKTEIIRLETESSWFGNEEQHIDPFASELVFPLELRQETPDLVEQATELYKVRQEGFATAGKTQSENIKQREQDIKEIKARIRNQRKSLVYLREQIKISEGLLEEKLTTRYKHLGFLKEESDLVSDIEEGNAALLRAESQFSSAKKELVQIANTHREEVQDGLRKARRDLLEFSQRLRKLSDSLQRTIIRSPAKGVVKSLYVRGEGEVVQPGMTVLDIVPLGDKLIIEARLALGDIGYIQAGQTATVKLPTGDARMFGNLDGVVKNISPDAITTPEGETYYRVLVETAKDHFEREGHLYQLYPGMQLLVSIKTGERTVLEYLVYPYFDTLYRGLQER